MAGLLPAASISLSDSQREEVRKVVAEEMDKHFSRLGRFTAIALFTWTALMGVGGYAIKSNIESSTLAYYMEKLTIVMETVTNAKRDAADAAKESLTAQEEAQKNATAVANAVLEMKEPAEVLANKLKVDDAFIKAVSGQVNAKLDRLSIASGLDGSPLVVSGNLVVDGYVAVRRPNDKGVLQDVIKLSSNTEGGEIYVYDKSHYGKVRIYNAEDNYGGVVRLFEGNPGSDSNGKFKQGTGLGGFEQ